jgi:predicted TIM-barrel fold metal-dependent hydrolase
MTAGAGQTLQTAGFVDAHMHLWHRENVSLRYSWMAPENRSSAAGNRDLITSPTYDFAGYRAETRFEAVAVDPVIETEWVSRELNSAGLPYAQVVGASLASGSLANTLDRHLEYPGVVGVRDALHGDWLNDRGLDEGFRTLAGYDLSLEVGCEWPHMGDLAALAGRHPDVRLVLVHAGLPMQRTNEYFDSWQQSMGELAEHPNVVCKISGLGLWDPLWTFESIRPWVLGCIESFGTQRCMFGSNWPIDRQYSSFDALLSAYRACIAPFTAIEQDAMIGGNAARIYRV